MNRLERLERGHSEQLFLLRRYLHQNEVEKSLGWRILRYVEFRLSQSRNRVPAASIWALKHLTGPMMAELSYATNFACLKHHPIFWECDATAHRAMLKMVDTALCSHIF